MPRIATQDGTELYVSDIGRGPAVVLIHGWPLNADSWEAQSVALVDAGFRVIAYDRRGFGRSDQPGGGYDYDTLAADLGSVTAASAAENPALVGFSMGGGEVARFLGRGGAASKAVLVGSIVPGLAQSASNPDGLPPEALQGILDGLTKDRPHFIADFLKTFYGVGLLSHPVSQELLDWSWGGAMMASPIATRECAKAFATTDFTGDLGGFTMPTLVIHGTSDANVPIDPTARRLKRLVPAVELVEYDGAPHGTTATHAARLNADLIAFLRR